MRPLLTSKLFLQCGRDIEVLQSSKIH